MAKRWVTVDDSNWKLPQEILDTLGSTGSSVIKFDTDGVPYFVAPTSGTSATVDSATVDTSTIA